MQRKTKWIVGGALAVVLVGGGAGIAVAGSNGGDDSEPSITGSDLDKASAAALEETGGGKVTDTEVGDEESYYEVEVTLDDGTQVDVQLDRDFNVVGSETDGPHEDDSAPAEDGRDDD